MTPTLLPEALRKLRAVKHFSPFSLTTITHGEAEALLDALDLLRRVRDCDSDATGNGISIDSETWALVCEAADVVVKSR